MSQEKMAIVLNGLSVVEYDRTKTLNEKQLEYLDKLESSMDNGIRLGADVVSEPDVLQRSQYIASYLVHALKTENDQVIAATCAYLALKQPDLKQVVITEDEFENITIEFVYDEEAPSQVKVDFSFPDTGLH